VDDPTKPHEPEEAGEEEEEHSRKESSLKKLTQSRDEETRQ